MITAQAAADETQNTQVAFITATGGLDFASYENYFNSLNAKPVKIGFVYPQKY
jgi:hypothetical protein